MDGNEKEFCILCAWRQTCQKQFSMKAGQKCPEYSRDITIKKEESPAEGEKD